MIRPLSRAARPACGRVPGHAAQRVVRPPGRPGAGRGDDGGLPAARRPPPGRSRGLLLEFRAGAAGLLARRWLRITVTTVASHLTLWLVLLACLRADGLTQAQVSWQASLAAFAFVRLLSVVPITPGGIGVIEVGLTAPLAAGLGPAGAAKVAAAVLLFRSATYLLPIPLDPAADPARRARLPGAAACASQAPPGPASASPHRGGLCRGLVPPAAPRVPAAWPARSRTSRPGRWRPAAGSYGAARRSPYTCAVRRPLPRRPHPASR